MGQCVVEFGCRCEPGLVDDVADAAVEALDHAVGLRMPGWAQAVLDAQRYAGKIEYMLTRRSFGFAREAVGELTAVVCEDSLDLHWRSPFEAAEEVSLLSSVDALESVENVDLARV